MSKCRHDELTVTVGVETDTGNIVDVVYCANPACDVDARAIIADLRNQRDASEKQAADAEERANGLAHAKVYLASELAKAEMEVERQKAAVQRLLAEPHHHCAPCFCREGCQWTQFQYCPWHIPNCKARRRAWAYGETKKEKTTE